MSARSVFERMHDRLFSRLGEQAVLRGTITCLANMEYGVVVSYEVGDDKYVQSEYASTVDIANILKQHAPKPGDELSVGGKDYIIDAIAADNGFMCRCVVRGA